MREHEKEVLEGELEELKRQNTELLESNHKLSEMVTEKHIL